VNERDITYNSLIATGLDMLPRATMATKPGSRIIQAQSKRLGFVLFASNTSNDLVVRMDGFAYNSLIPADRFLVLPDEAFRP
jgi:hypothetical protein